MRLPSAESVIAEDAKIRDYLLAPDHPVGRFKSVFFYRLGYRRERWQALQEDLRGLAATGEAEFGVANAYGRKYIVRGMLTGPAGRRARVTTVWIVLHGESAPRLVTAFPGGS